MAQAVLSSPNVLWNKIRGGYTGGPGGGDKFFAEADFLVNESSRIGVGGAERSIIVGPARECPRPKTVSKPPHCSFGKARFLFLAKGMPCSLLGNMLC
jgi:hypothetical protein